MYIDPFDILISILLEIQPEVGLLDYKVILLILFEEAHTVFHKAAPFYIPHFFHILDLFLFNMAALVDVRWYLILVLVCISLMMRDGEYLFICLLTIWISFLEKYPLKFLAHFLIMLFLLFVCSG